MKILLVTRYFYPRLGGGELVLWQILKGLAQKGHKTLVITSKVDNSPEHEIIDNIEIYRPFDGADSFGKGLRFSLKLFSYLGKFHKNNPVDVAINGAYSCTIPASWAARKSRIAAVTYVTSYFGNVGFNLVNPFTAVFNYMYPVTTLYFAKSDIICCPSKTVGEKLGRYSKSKAIVIPSPIDAGEIRRVKARPDPDMRAKLGIGKGQRFVLFVGRLSPEKNICNLIKTLNFSALDLKLIIVGEGPERKKIEAVVDRLGLKDRVSLLGRRSHEDALTIMNACDVLVLSSITEVFPTVVLEALAMEKPVISTRVGGVSEVASDNLYLIDHLEDINQVLLCNLKSRPDPLTITRYSQENIIDSFEDMLEKAVSKQN
jgi:glycosyltransferase involved in cell wall biosynthesis